MKFIRLLTLSMMVSAACCFALHALEITVTNTGDETCKIWVKGRSDDTPSKHNVNPQQTLRLLLKESFFSLFVFKTTGRLSAYTFTFAPHYEIQCDGRRNNIFPMWAE